MSSTVTGTLLLLISSLPWSAASPAQKDCESGLAALQSGDYLRAEADLERCAYESPTLAVYLQLAAVYQSLSRHDKLVMLAEEGIRLFPQEPRFYLTVGLSAGRNGKFDQALGVFLEAHRRWPGDQRFRQSLTQARIARGLAGLDQHRNEEAEADLRAAVELEPDNVEALLNWGRALQNLNRSLDALDAFEKVIRLDPKLPSAHFHLGMVQYTLGDYEAAIPTLTIEIERNPDHSPSHFFRGMSYFFRGDWALSLHDLDLASKGMAYDFEVVFARGRCLLQLERLDEAEAALRQAMALKPSDAGPYYALGQLLRRRGQAQAAQEMFRTAAQRHSRNRSVEPGDIRYAPAPAPAEPR